MSVSKKYITILLPLIIFLSLSFNPLVVYAQNKEKATPYTDKRDAINLKYICKLYFNKSINKPEDIEKYLSIDESIGLSQLLILGCMDGDCEGLSALIYLKALEIPGGAKIIKSYENEINAAAKLKNQTDIDREKRKERKKAIKDSDYEKLIKTIRDSLSQWCEKGEFETQDDWNQRLQQSSGEKFIHTCNAIIKKQIHYKFSDVNMSLKDYNADGEFFLFKYQGWDVNLKLKIPISKAENFKSKMENEYLFNSCFLISNKTDNCLFYKFNILPKEIVFYNLEETDMVFKTPVVNEWDEIIDYSYSSNDSIRRLRPMQTIPFGNNNELFNQKDGIGDIIIYFDDLGLENQYLNGSYYNYTKQKFHPNSTMAKLYAEQDAIQQRMKAEQDRKRTNDSIFQQAENNLQQAVDDYNIFSRKLSCYYNNINRLSLTLPDSLNGNYQKLSETLNLLLDSILSQKEALLSRYLTDSIIFSEHDEMLQAKVAEVNAQLLAYPYNLQKQTLKDSLSLKMFGKSEDLERELQVKISFLPEKQKQLEKEVYKETMMNEPQRFVEIYFIQNPSEKHLADSTYKECGCQFANRLSFNIAWIRKRIKIWNCDCRENKYQETRELFHSREEFDQSFNMDELTFEQEVTERRNMFLKIKQLDLLLSSRKQINTRKALSSSNPEIADILNRVREHRNSYYYIDAIDLILKYDEKLEREWNKNGFYFKSKEELYECWIGEDYEKELKIKKKG